MTVRLSADGHDPDDLAHATVELQRLAGADWRSGHSEHPPAHDVFSPDLLRMPPSPPPDERHADDLPPGEYRVVAALDGCATHIGESFTLPAGGNHHLDVRLRPGRVLRGRVVDGAGAPIEDALLTLHVGDLEVPLAASDATGAFETRQLPEVDAEVELSELLGPEVRARVAAGQTTLGDVVLDGPSPFERALSDAADDADDEER